MGTLGRRRLKVLVIDDNQQMARVVAHAIGDQVECVCLDSAIDALLSIADGNRFDAILCDLKLPIMNGLGLYSRLLKLAPDQAERMIFMTGDTDRAAQLWREAPRARGAITKPFSLEDLRRLLT